MTADTIITMLLIVAAMVAGLMAYVARQQIPGQTEYQARPRPATSSSDWSPHRSQTRSPHRRRPGGGLGRDDDHGHARRTSGLGQDEWEGSHQRRRTSDAGDGLGRGHGDAYGRDYGDHRARPRYHANGSSGPGDRGYEHTGPDHGFEAWARANGFRWSDASSAPPPPPPSPPAGPHWSTVLDIPRTAGSREIRKAYAKVMRSLHPDVAIQDATTSQRCTDARLAYERAKMDAQAAGRP